MSRSLPPKYRVRTAAGNTPPKGGRKAPRVGALAGYGGLVLVVLLVLGILVDGGNEDPAETPAAPSVVATHSTGPDSTTEAAPTRTATSPEILPTAAPASATATRPAAPAEKSVELQEPAEDGTALALLYALELKGRAPKTGYDRDLFAWRDDVDHNGCDTRNDVLRRDLVDIELADDGCVVLDGTLTSAYSGDTFDFVRGDGNNIDIDHVVALSNAWQTGAQELSAEERVEFGNDPLNLLATESGLNAQKGDGDAATWLPPLRSYRCEYVARQVSVKSKYGLWVTQPEFDAIEGLLLDCEGQPAIDDDPWPATSDGDVASEPAPVYAPEPAQAPEPAPEPAPDHGNNGASGAFENCSAARAAGAAPVHRGDPGYGPHLDRDDDGVGCE
ncbi:GmrSD restriction endonuclease domain-containing protein [Brevibacterium samyangense]|uniref:Excalibur calcium-binding domain-containing protein n=1 Tax=Brevibacterium samyangense TaxID=366888 RepID=A0ABN2T5Q3_9MICO